MWWSFNMLQKWCECKWYLLFTVLLANGSQCCFFLPTSLQSGKQGYNKSVLLSTGNLSVCTSMCILLCFCLCGPSISQLRSRPPISGEEQDIHRLLSNTTGSQWRINTPQHMVIVTLEDGCSSPSPHLGNWRLASSSLRINYLIVSEAKSNQGWCIAQLK